MAVIDTIKIRRNTAAGAAASNPVLAVGEMGLETDTNRFKFGDGSTAWNSLPYGTAGTVTTNANLTGPITSTGNATAIASQTGTGTMFVMSVSPIVGTTFDVTATGTGDPCILPRMSNSVPAAQAVSSSTTVNSQNDTYMAFNGDPATGWLANTTTGTLTVDLGTPMNAVIYSIVGARTGNLTNSLKTWFLLGSTTGAFAGEEVQLDTRTEAGGWTAGQKRSYTITTPGAYRYFRINGTVCQSGGSYIGVIDWQLFTGQVNVTHGDVNFFKIGTPWAWLYSSVICQPQADSLYAFQILRAANDAQVVVVDTTNNRVGINCAAPTYSLTVTSQADGDGFAVFANGTAPQFSLYTGTTASYTQVGAFGFAKSATNWSNAAGANDVVVRAVGSGSGGNLIMTCQNSTGNLIFATGSASNNDTAKMTLLNSGRLGIGVTAPTAMLHLKAGTATSSTAPLKFNAGTLLSSLELGALEFTDDGANGHLYITRNVSGVLTRTQIV